MTEKRTVECQDCGYRWESSATNPRCSKSDCGRSRNVEAVDGDRDDDPDESTSSVDSDELTETTQVEDDDDLEDDVDDGGGGFTASFESIDQRTETDDADLDLDALGSTSQEDEDDADQEASDDEQGAEPAEDVPELDPEQLEAAFSLTFDVVDQQQRADWTLDDDEAAKLGKAWAPVANEYMPYMLAEHTEIGIAVVCTASIVMPRLARERTLADREEQEAREAANGEAEIREPEPVDDEPSTTIETTDTAAPDTGGYANV